MASSDVSDDDGQGSGFRYNGVGPKGKGKSRHKAPTSRARRGAHGEPQGSAARGDSEALVSEIRQSIERKRRELLTAGKHGSDIQRCLSSYFSLLRADYSSRDPSGSGLPTRIYALGIGEISQSRSAQVQVALLLEMADQIVRIAEGEQNSKSGSESGSETSSSTSSQGKKEGAATSRHRPLRPALMAFDPVFSATDRAVLTALGVTALTREEASAQACYDATFATSCEEAAITSDRGDYTLLYMPHCPRPLSERYLRAFWTREALLKRRVTFCWNRVGRYAEFLTDEKLNRESPCLYRVIPHLKSHPLPSLPQPYAEAFNDLVFESMRDVNEDIDRTAEATGLSPNQSSNRNEGLVDDLSRLRLSNPASSETHASDPNEGPGQAPSADEAPGEVGFTVQVARKKKKRRPQRNGIARGEDQAVLRPDIQSDDFWKLPPVFEGGEGSEEIL